MRLLVYFVTYSVFVLPLLLATISAAKYFPILAFCAIVLVL